MNNKVLYIEPEDIDVYYNNPDEITRHFMITVRWLDEGKKCARAFSFSISKEIDYSKLELLAKTYNYGIMRILQYFYDEYLPNYSKLEDVSLTPLAVNKIYDTVSETY